MLNKNNLSIGKICSKDSYGYSNISHIRVEKKRTIATDGVKAVEVSRPKKIKKTECPQISRFKIREKRPFLLSPQDAQDIIRTIPKYPGMPILQNVFISQDGDKTTELATTDLERARKFTIREIEGDYPDIDSVYPKGKPRAKIVLNAKALKELMDVFQGFKDWPPSVEMEVYEKHEPILFKTETNSGQKIKGLLMPMSEKKEKK